MESWREELYASDYGSQYLMHYRTKGSKNGISHTPGYKAIGELAQGPIKKELVDARDKQANSNSNQTIRKTTATISPKASKVELSSGQSSYTMPDGKANQDYIESKRQQAGGIPNDIGWIKNIARIDENLASEVDREDLVNDLITNDKWFAGAVNVLGEKDARETINKYLDDYLSVEPNGWPEVPAGQEVDLEKRKAEQEAEAKRKAEQEAAAEKKQAQSQTKKIDKVAMLDKQTKEAGESNPEWVAKKTSERMISQIKNEKIGSIIKDYASIAGDIGKLLLKGSALELASIYSYGLNNGLTDALYEWTAKDAKSLGRKIGIRKAKNRIRKGG